MRILLVLMILSLPQSSYGLDCFAWIKRVAKRLFAVEGVHRLTENEILQILKTSKMTPVLVLTVGDSKPLKMRLKKSQHGVFKIGKGSDDPQMEVAAFLFDRLVGLGLIPPTVMRTHEGKTGSLQFFVEGGKNPYETMSFANRKLRFLDLFLFNGDRHADNFLIMPDGSQVAIDNMKAFRAISSELPHEWVVENAVPPREYYEKLKAIEEKEFHSTLDAWIGVEKVNALIRRRDQFVKQVETWIVEKGADAIFPQ